MKKLAIIGVVFLSIGLYFMFFYSPITQVPIKQELSQETITTLPHSTNPTDQITKKEPPSMYGKMAKTFEESFSEPPKIGVDDFELYKEKAFSVRIPLNYTEFDGEKDAYQDEFGNEIDADNTLSWIYELPDKDFYIFSITKHKNLEVSPEVLVSKQLRMYYAYGTTFLEKEVNGEKVLFNSIVRDNRVDQVWFRAKQGQNNWYQLELTYSWNNWEEAWAKEEMMFRQFVYSFHLYP